MCVDCSMRLNIEDGTDSIQTGRERSSHKCSLKLLPGENHKVHVSTGIRP